MPAYPKIRDQNVAVLKKAYLDQEMSTTKISNKSDELFGFFVNPATVYNCLVRYGIPLRSKGVGVSLAKRKLSLKSITKTSQELWNARWLISTKQISCIKSMLQPAEAEKLRLLLDQPEGNMIPNDLIQKEFKKAKLNGFPYYDLSDEIKQKEWTSLLRHVPAEADAYPWAGQGSRLASSFHQHLFECRRKGKLTPVEFFNSDEDLKRGIGKVLCLYGKVTESHLREICRNEKASSRVNNFPPRVAMAILQHLFKGQKISVLDPCSGFSGRLLGCGASDIVDEYWGIDISDDTYNGLSQTQLFLDKVGCSMKVELKRNDCLVAMAAIDRKFDCIMTSPPFLDVEEYKGVAFQTEYEEWLKTFIKPFLVLCREKLKVRGKMVMYLEKIRNFDFKADVERMAEEAGFKKVEDIKFKMSYGENNRTKEASRVMRLPVWTL